MFNQAIPLEKPTSDMANDSIRQGDSIIDSSPKMGPNSQSLATSSELLLSNDAASVGLFRNETPESPNSIASSPPEAKLDHDKSPATSSEQTMLDDPELPVNKVQFSGASLLYSYTFEALFIRYDLKDESGSEHRINSRAYPAELQILAYNSHLYHSYYEASLRPLGLLAISILVDLLPAKKVAPHTQLSSLLNKLAKIKHRGNSVPISGFNISALLPETEYFVTYDGSLTIPGCHESVVWLLLNKPLYASQAQVSSL